MPYSYAGEPTRIGLRSRDWRIEPIHNKSVRKYLLGAGLAAKIYFDEMDPSRGPLDPASGLILMIGVLSGYRTPIKGLCLSGSGVHPGGGLNGIPGHNTAQVVLHDLGYVESASGGGLGNRISKWKGLFQAFMKVRRYL